MAQIPQINNPITSKNYNYSPRQQDANTEPFDIVKLTGVGTNGVNSDAAMKNRLEMGNRELIPLRVQVAKDPTLAVEVLKDLLNVEVLNQALITGHTELYGSLETLAKELYITPEQLLQEIINQEQQNTMFSGHEFYDVLREIAQTTTDTNTKDIIGNLLKSINFAQNREEILGALRANMKFLSEYYSPNEKLSEKLLNLSKEWGADDAEEYFEYLKGETLAILNDVSGSLLNDDKTQMLIPLIKHNLSRYNNSPYMCKEYFNLLLTQISSGTVREALKNSFNRLYAALFEKKPMQDPQTIPTMEDIGQIPDENAEELYTDNYTTNPEQNQQLAGKTDTKNAEILGAENQNQHSEQILNKNFGDFDDDIDLKNLGNTIDAMKGKTAEDFGDLDDDIDLENLGNTIDAMKGRTAETAEASESKQPQSAQAQSKQPQSAQAQSTQPQSEQLQPEQSQELSGWAKALNNLMGQREYTQMLKDSGVNIDHIVSAYTRGKMSGLDALKTISEGLFLKDPGNDVFVGDMLAEFDQVNTMQELIDNLNAMLRGMPDVPLRERLYGVFVDIIDKMSVRNELPQHGIRPPVSSTLDNLTDFIQKNINNPALKSLDSFNAANLLQSLLNAPGVFTPLAHYILPLQVGNTRSFGELWVDNDENNPNNTPGTQRNYHLFLTFDVESIGRFELDMYALGEEVNISLLYPPRFEKEIEPMKDRVNKIVRSSGYSTRAFETAPLKKPHNLVEVFPKITDKRTTLSKRV